MSRMSVLSKPDILLHFKAGNIVIHPFNPANLANTSYDVRLGKYFFRQFLLDITQTLNPFYRKSVAKLYSEPQEAPLVKEYSSPKNPFHNLSPKDRIILISPGETILAHTIEFIGGKNGVGTLPAVTTEMRARSSIGRLGVAVCKCAGWGDIGYINRWTMEVTNFSSCIIPLPVGLRIAQIIFHAVTPVHEKDQYQERGKYQAKGQLAKLRKNWKPELMLPKLYLDPDLGHFSRYAKG